MMHSMKGLGCLAVFMLATVILALGQSSPYLSTPFDSSRSTLGVNFKGHDIAAVASAIEHSPYLKDKSEFETVAEYKERLSQSSKRALLGKLTSDSQFAFVIEERRVMGDDGYSFKYDADSRVLTTTLLAYWGFSGGEDGLSLQIGSNKHHVRDYMASNAFGVKAQVSETVYHVYKLHIPGYTNRTVDINLTPEEAKAVKNDARVLVLCHLRSPWYIKESKHFDPEIDSPSDFTVYDHILPAVIDEVWVFNQRTGKILTKAKAPAAQNVANLSQAVAPEVTVKQLGSIRKIEGAVLTLTTEQGLQLAVKLKPGTRILRIAPGETDPKSAVAIQLTGLQSGDRVWVRGNAAADGSVDATTIMVMEN